MSKNQLMSLHVQRLVKKGWKNVVLLMLWLEYDAEADVFYLDTSH